MERIIPNLFHFIFGLKEQTEPFHLCFYLCLESCFQVNHPAAVYFYYHYEPYGEYWELVKKCLELVQVDFVSFVSRYKYGFRNRKCKRYGYAHHADFIRLEKLIEKGGIYADIDTIFVNKIPDYLFTKPFVLGREDNVPPPGKRQLSPSLCNAFIMSARNAEFAVKWREHMEKEFDGSWSNHSTFLPQRLSKQYPDLIHIEPKRTFYKHMWKPEGIHTLFKGCDQDTEDVVSMHLWSHLWWSKERKDFSDFHEGVLIPEYIRTVDTTYNLIARRFLPE